MLKGAGGGGEEKNDYNIHKALHRTCVCDPVYVL